jgi:hypothetical protein
MKELLIPLGPGSRPGPARPGELARDEVEAHTDGVRSRIDA